MKNRIVTNWRSSASIVALGFGLKVTFDFLGLLT